MWRRRVRRFLHRFGYDVRYEPQLRFDDTGIDKFVDISRHLSAKPVVLDIGANVGQTITAVRRAFPDATIHAFEPSPLTFAELERKCGGLPRVHLNCVALGRRRSTVQFSQYEDSQFSSVLPPGPDATTRVVSTVSVSLRSVDDYCAEHGIAYVDLLKTDTQGFELEVLSGADRMFGEGRVSLVLVELIFSADYARQARYHEILRYLDERGFQAMAFYDAYYVKGRLVSCNALLVRRSSQTARLHGTRRADAGPGA
jgi:FkbM family methyltransferase